MLLEVKKIPNKSYPETWFVLVGGLRFDVWKVTNHWWAEIRIDATSESKRGAFTGATIEDAMSAAQFPKYIQDELVASITKEKGDTK